MDRSNCLYDSIVSSTISFTDAPSLKDGYIIGRIVPSPIIIPDFSIGLTEEQKAFNELINKQIYEETANNLEQYEQYGLTYNSDENQLFFNGKSVCYFADNRATDGTFEGTEVHSANGDIGIITERDRNGNITGLKQMEIPELTDFLEKSWKEK